AERWREAVAALPAEARLVYNADDPQLAVVGEAHGGGVAFGLDDPGVARPSLQHAADSKYCVRCGTPYDYAAAYVGHLGDYRCPNCGHARPLLSVVARNIRLHGLDAVAFRLETPDGVRDVRLGVPGLYNVYNALAGAIEVIPALERALDRGLELTPEGDELILLPTYTAMLALRKIVGERGFVRPYWERAA